MIESERSFAGPDERAGPAPSDQAPVEAAELMALLVQQFSWHDDPDALAARLVELAAEHLPGACAASVTVARDGDFATLASSDDRARRADLAQYDTGEGPCLSIAVTSLIVLHSADAARDLRWPRFAQRVADLRVGSVLSFGLPSRSGNLGSLNVYAPRPFAFSRQSDQLGRLLAGHAAPLLRAAQDHVELRKALAIDALVARAQGMLMERLGVDGDRALAALRSIATADGRSVAETAGLLTDRPASRD